MPALTFLVDPPMQHVSETPGISAGADNAAGSANSIASWALSTWTVASTVPATAARRADDAAPGEKVGWMVQLAAHELRNSLSAIQLGVELLSRRDNAAHHPASSAVLAHMDSAAQRAQSSTVELEDLYRLAAGKHLSVSPTLFSLHTVVRDALDASRLIVPGVIVEHDRLGEGDCIGDPTRMAQFLALALEDLSAAATPALIIVISEVAGDRFRIAVHVDGVRSPAPSTHEPATRRVQMQERRRVLMQAIAQAHGGQVQFGSARMHGRSIDGSFARLAMKPASAPSA